jgi:hypothetical protein
LGKRALRTYCEFRTAAAITCRLGQTTTTASIRGSAAYVIASMFPPVIAPAGSRGVGNNRTRCGADQPSGNCGASRPACQATDKRAAATADQCTAENPVLSSTTRTAGECQSHRNHDQGAVHLVLLCGPIFLPGARPISARPELASQKLPHARSGSEADEYRCGLVAHEPRSPWQSGHKVQLATFWSDIRFWDFGDWPARVRHQSKKPTIAARNQTPLLTELGDDSLGVRALNALECALILERPFA